MRLRESQLGTSFPPPPPTPPEEEQPAGLYNLQVRAPMAPGSHPTCGKGVQRGAREERQGWEELGTWDGAGIALHSCGDTVENQT